MWIGGTPCCCCHFPVLPPISLAQSFHTNRCNSYGKMKFTSLILTTSIDRFDSHIVLQLGVRVFACMSLSLSVCVCKHTEWEALPVSSSTFPFIHEFNRSKLYKILHSIFFPSAHPPNEAHLLEIRKHIRLAATPPHTLMRVSVSVSVSVSESVYTCLVCILYVEFFFRCYYFYHYYCYCDSSGADVGERNT